MMKKKKFKAEEVQERRNKEREKEKGKRKRKDGRKIEAEDRKDEVSSKKQFREGVQEFIVWPRRRALFGHFRWF